jgi:hypothetical protein
MESAKKTSKMECFLSDNSDVAGKWDCGFHAREFAASGRKKQLFSAGGGEKKCGRSFKVLKVFKVLRVLKVLQKNGKMAVAKWPRRR